MPTDIFLSLGSNLGNRGQYLRAAIVEIGKIADIRKQSSIWESKAWGVTDQRDFLNVALAVSTKLSPQRFLERLQVIEQRLGRQKREKWHEREIDIDIIFWGNKTIHSEHLIIPHLHWRERSFVVLPLAEFAPDFVPPGTDKSLAQFAAALRTAPSGGICIKKRSPQ